MSTRMQEAVTEQNPNAIDLSGRDVTARLNRDELHEGWAELGKTPRLIATIKMGAKTDLGRVRENNEDKFDFFEPEDPAVLAAKGAFYAVADGMGGHSAGQIASELALKTVMQAYYANPSADTNSSLRVAIQDANSLVFDTAQAIPDRQGMGTTMTVAVVREDQLTVAQVGDSRAYLVRDGEITQLTQDHSWVAEQVRLGAMSADEAHSSPFRNIITRSVGTAQTVEPDLATHSVQAGDTVLLCSDGLTGHVSPDGIAAVLREYTPSAAASRLIEEANANGGRDNITVVVLSIRSVAPYAEPQKAEGAAPPAEAEPPENKPEKRSWGRRK